MIDTTGLDIYKLPPIAASYPIARYSMLPLLDRKYLALQKDNCGAISRFLEADAIFLPSGRVALYMALQMSDVTANTDVLLPSYHCGSMVEPVLHLKANAIFYKINSDLSYNLFDIQEKITHATKALVIPHFFGFLQDLLPLKKLCNDRGVRLIEDCAHCFYSSGDKNGAGYVGDFAIASSIKFFPGTKGGVLAINKQSLPHPKLVKPSLLDEIKDLKRTIDRCRQYSALKIHENDGTKSPEIHASEAVTYELQKIAYNNYLWFDPNEIGCQNSAVNQWLIKMSRHKAIIEKRLKNYTHYLECFTGLDGVTPLHRSLGNNIPYVFPVLLENPDSTFYKLKLKGVPIWRWEELVQSDCQISNDYRHQLLQLPCHQSVNEQDIEWIVECFRKTN